MNWLMLFGKMIAIYTDDHTKTINTQYSVPDC
jgi:hypothetical protein